MHATQILDKHLSRRCQGIHKSRWQALMSAVGALVQGKKLSVTGLGRAMTSAAYEKHNIKRADRLVGNPMLNQERVMIYRALVSLLLGPCRQPVILVDWSNLSADRQFHLLRASLAVGGRALTLYEETHTQRYYGNARIQRRFLSRLAEVLPARCRPIVITDAGFRTPWFGAVRAMGWDFVGRVGGQTMISPQGKDDWIRVEQLFEVATARARYLGYSDLVRNNPCPCHAYLLKRKKQGRIKRTRFGQRCEMKHSQKNAHRERTPWLIVTSLPGGAQITNRVMNLYRTRMQIEEAFRDIKNPRWGFSLAEARSTTAWRYENLLLIGSLATVAVWLVGKAAELKQWHRRYQANTIKTRNVLSTFYLGCQVLRKTTASFRRCEFQQAIDAARQQILAQAVG